MSFLFQELVSSKELSIQPIAVPAGVDKITVVIDEWSRGTVDLDIEVSYDGGKEWMYGGGCKGAVSASPSIEIHMKYGAPITNLRGRVYSDTDINSTVRIFT